MLLYLRDLPGSKAFPLVSMVIHSLKFGCMAFASVDEVFGLNVLVVVSENSSSDILSLCMLREAGSLRASSIWLPPRIFYKKRKPLFFKKYSMTLPLELFNSKTLFQNLL